SALPAADLLPPVQRELDRMSVSRKDRNLTALVDAVKARSRTILHVAQQVAIRLDPARAEVDPKGEALIRKLGPAFAINLKLAVEALHGLSEQEWTPDNILERLKTMATAHGLKLGDALQPIRVALTGSTVSEPVNELLAVVGQKRSIARMEDVAARQGTDESA